MKKHILLIGVAVIMAIPAQGKDDYPRVEIFGGYSFLRTDADFRDNIPKGWGSSVAGNLHRNFGIEANFSGHYGHSGPVAPFDDSNYLFQFGPRVVARLDRFTPWGHGLLGASQSRIAGSGTTRTNFAWALGGGLDLRIHKNVALRVVQADYVRMKVAALTAMAANGSGLTTGPIPSNNLRLSFGVVLRLGGG